MRFTQSLISIQVSGLYNNAQPRLWNSWKPCTCNRSVSSLIRAMSKHHSRLVLWLIDWPYQAPVLHAILAMRQHRSRLALRLSNDPFIHRFTPALWPWDISVTPSSQALGWILSVCTIFTPVTRPWDSTVSWLALRPSVMRQHRFTPPSQTVKDHPHSLLRASLNLEPQGSNLSFTLAHTHTSCLVTSLLVGCQLFHSMHSLT